MSDADAGEVQRSALADFARAFPQVAERGAGQ